MGEVEDIKTISSNTIVVHGRKMEFNCLRNLTAVVRSHGIKELRHQFKGLPAVVCGAGPSLDMAIPLLKEHQGSYVLVCADRALPPLLKAGIIPHIVCTSDMDVELVNLFSGYRIPESVALLYDRDCYWELPAAWVGPLLTYDTYFDAGIWESSFIGHKGFCCKNFTVSHTALYVASMLGCSPIIMAGVDFAYLPDAHHASGVVVNHKEPDELHRAHWVDIPGNVLEKVHTTEVFGICVPAMTAQIEELKADAINSSEIGAKIPRARYQPLEAALKEHGKPMDYQAKLNACLEASPQTFDREAFDVHTAHVVKSMTRIHNQCAEGIDIMKRLKKLDINNSTEVAKWGRVFLKANQLLMKIQSDVFCMYLMQRPMLASTKKTGEMLQAVKHLPEKDHGRLQVEANRHSVYFWWTGVCARLFVDALSAVRKELLSPVEVADGVA